MSFDEQPDQLSDCMEAFDKMKARVIELTGLLNSRHLGEKPPIFIHAADHCPAESRSLKLAISEQRWLTIAEEWKTLAEKYRAALERISNEGGPDFDADDMAACATRALSIQV